MPSPNVDQGWAWVILFASFCGTLINGTILFSTGVIMDAMLDEVDPNLTLVSWIGSIHTACMCFSGIVKGGGNYSQKVRDLEFENGGKNAGVKVLSGLAAGVVITKYGCRVSAFCGAVLNFVGMTASYVSKGNALLIFTYSILGGTGCGFGNNASFVACGYYFKKYRALASGIVACGSGFGMFAGPPIIRILIATYNVHGTFLLLGGVASNFCVLGMLMRPSPIESYNKHVALHSSSMRDVTSRPLCVKIKEVIYDLLVMFKDVAFVAYMVSVGLWALGDTVTVFHLPNYTQHKGTSAIDSALLLTVMGTTALFSRLLTGLAATDANIGPEILHMGLLGLSGLLTILFPLFSNSFGTQAMYSAGYGLYSGGIVTLFNPLVADIVRVERLANGLGLSSASKGIGALVGAPVAGMIVEGSGMYEHSYVFAGASLLLSSIISLPISRRRKDDPRLTEIELDVPPEEKPLQQP